MLPPAASKTINYETDIRPLFQSRCLGCHGPEMQESQLRLDRRASLIRGGSSGEPAILPGNSAESHLIHLVSGLEPDRTMPPDPDDRLSAQEIGLLRAWIDQQAAWPGPDGAESDDRPAVNHWAFLPIRSPEPPFAASGSSHPIDAFIVQSLRARGLTGSDEANRRQLIRRLWLDIAGLPPKPEDVRKFLEDTEEGAYERLVEQVLNSPHYGERWARYWLDLVRFAETNGYETNRERPNAWPWRDYVIRSLNSDKPYNQFLREQLAGDALGVPEATGFLVAGPYDLVKSPDISLTLMQRNNELDDIIGTTSTAFLGLTLGCARCHNHKFDPMSQTDYYAWQAIFAGVSHGDRILPLSESNAKQLSLVDQEIQSLTVRLSPFIKKNSEGTRDPVTHLVNEELLKPTKARFVRFTIRATNGSEPCVDELEVFSSGKNVALASFGTRVTSSGDLPGYEIHKLEHLNDGRYGNQRSWIANKTEGWVQLEFPQEFVIDRITWGRDRNDQFRDRVATDYQFEVGTEPEILHAVASSADRRPYSQGRPQPPVYDFADATSDEAAAGQAWLKQLEELRERRKQLNAAATVYAGQFQQPGPVHRLFRGDPMAKRETVLPGTVAFLGSLGLEQSASEQDRRLALASWIAADNNPLTARVIVNRLWQFHFGKGLVSTPSDFGVAGVPPTHPDLLDWLASQLISHNWSLKHIHRLILTSATWKQSSRPLAEALEKDANTEFWWRFPPRRLEAEPIRDGILSVTGLLDTRMYGPGFSAFEVQMENVRHYFPKQKYGPEDWRRMIYMTKVRQQQDSVFGIFDCPDAATSVPRRTRSTTPLQALNLFNSTFMLQQAGFFADRLRNEAGSDSAMQVVRAFELCFSREPDSTELDEAVTFVKDQSLTEFCRAMLNSNEFLFMQ